uniref:Uncharacterized protein n=1 Tax=Panagrolaimus sp. ES5 TaxID=591445 RepID=A0AC34G8J5_9BILA
MASANTNTAAMAYPARIKYENGFLLDQRMGQRKVVGINNEIPYTLIRFELAQVEDRAMLGQFLVDHFNKHCSIFSVLNPTFEDTAPFLYDMLDHLLHKNISIMAFEDNKLIEIDNGPFPTRKGNQIGTVCGECYWQTGKFLPKDIKNLGATEAVGVLSQYTRSKLFHQMMDISERLFRENDCNYVAAYCAAKATYEYCKK